MYIHTDVCTIIIILSHSDDSRITNLGAIYLKNVTITPPSSLCFASYNLMAMDSVESADFFILYFKSTLHFTII